MFLRGKYMAHTVEQDVVGEPSKSRPRILLADGHSDIRQHLAQLLSRHYQVDTAADASTTLTLARSRPPDLVVADVMMRALRDFDLLCDSHGNKWEQVPIILYSPPCDESSCVNVLEAVAGDHMVTPCSEDQFLALIRSELRAARIRRDSIQSLRLSQERFRTLKTMLSPDVWVKSPDGQIISELAPWWEQLTGQSREQYTGFGYL